MFNLADRRVLLSLTLERLFGVLLVPILLCGAGPMCSGNSPDGNGQDLEGIEYTDSMVSQGDLRGGGDLKSDTNPRPRIITATENGKTMSSLSQVASQVCRKLRRKFSHEG